MNPVVAAEINKEKSIVYPVIPPVSPDMLNAQESFKGGYDLAFVEHEIGQVAMNADISQTFQDIDLGKLDLEALLSADPFFDSKITFQEYFQNSALRREPAFPLRNSMMQTFSQASPPVVAAVPLEKNSDDFWDLDETEEDPLATFNQPQQIDHKKKMLEKTRQEQLDAEYARKLQNEEYNSSFRASLASQVSRSSIHNDIKTQGSGAFAKISRNGSSFREDPPQFSPDKTDLDYVGKQANRIDMSTKEIHTMAVDEIGKDNVKILSEFVVVKYGREGRPKQRKVWVNSSLTHLCWESGQYEGSNRGLELSNVVRMRVGEMTKNIARSTKDYRKVRKLCFSLETKERTLDLQACSVIQRDTLVAALTKAVEFNHKYKPKRKDRGTTSVLVYTD
eukprot:maker-scaffold_2-snap-gene-19.38-mRNA-1 protein AED:0.01 eAED:0.01 QI:377/1/1/1/0.66/0.5/4/61/392